MENAYTKTPAEALRSFQVTEENGLSERQVRDLREKHGRNALPEDPPTPIWELILEQFKDQLVIILLGSAAISFVLALFEDGEGWTAFVDPAVVSSIFTIFTPSADIDALDPHHPHPQCRCRSFARNKRRESHRRPPRILGQRGQGRS